MFWKPQTILCFSPLSSFCNFRRLAAVDRSQQSCQLGLALPEASLNDTANNLPATLGGFSFFFSLVLLLCFSFIAVHVVSPPHLVPQTQTRHSEGNIWTKDLLRACWHCTEETSKPEFRVCVCVCVCVLGAPFQNHSINAAKRLQPHVVCCGPVQSFRFVVTLAQWSVPVVFSFHRWLQSLLPFGFKCCHQGLSCFWLNLTIF